MLHMAHASRYHWEQVGQRGEPGPRRVAAARASTPCSAEPSRRWHHARRVLELCRGARPGRLGPGLRPRGDRPRATPCRRRRRLREGLDPDSPRRPIPERTRTGSSEQEPPAPRLSPVNASGRPGDHPVRPEVVGGLVSASRAGARPSAALPDPGDDRGRRRAPRPVRRRRGERHLLLADGARPGERQRHEVRIGDPVDAGRVAGVRRVAVARHRQETRVPQLADEMLGAHVGGGRIVRRGDDQRRHG